MSAPTEFRPLTDAEWPAEIADMLGGFAGGLNVHRTIARHPALLRAIAPLREHVVNATALGPQLSEIAILRAGRRLGSSYEWSQHIVRARARGLSDARIKAAAGPLAEMAADDATVAGAVDELFETHALSEASTRALLRLGGEGAVFDLIATVSFYSMLGYALNSFGVPLDEDIAAELEATPLR